MTNTHLETFTDANFDAEVLSLPTLRVFRGGRVIARVNGAVPRKTLDDVFARLL